MAAQLRKFTLNRNLTLHSVLGHSIRFVKGEPTFVPTPLIPEVVALGATAVDNEPGIEVPEEKPVVREPDEQERGLAILAAVELIIERNNRMDFTAGGSPTAKAVEKIVGFDVYTREVNAALQDYRNKQAEV